MTITSLFFREMLLNKFNQKSIKIGSNTKL